MKRLFAILFLCGFWITSANGETISYNGGDKYVGEVSNGVPHGQGTLTYSAGHKYFGEFKNGKRHGQGTFTWADGESYVGEFRDDDPHGQGTYTFADGRMIVGEQKEGKAWNAIHYKVDGSVSGTYTEGKWCAGCKSTDSASTASAQDILHSWCAGIFGVSYTRKAHCRYRLGGEVYASKSQAEAEHKRLKAASSTASGEKEKQESYAALRNKVGAIKSKIEGNWSNRMACSGQKVTVSVRVHFNGDVRFVKVVGDSGDDACRRSAENAVFKASPLPFPDNPRFFKWLDQEFQIIFKPDLFADPSTAPSSGSAPELATLTVRSNPTYADVYINNAYKGKTVVRVEGSPGYYDVRVEKDGYNSFQQEIQLKNDADVWASLTKKEVLKPEPKPEPPSKLIGTGTGFVVNKDYIVTADHVVAECREVSIRYAHKEYLTEIAARDTSNDLGLLRLEDSISHSAKLRGGKAIRIGEVISTYGYPLFGELSDSAKITQGNINSLAGIGNDSRVIQFDAPTQPGNSGGPVLDSSGNVVGVVSHGLSKKYANASGHIAQNVNFAVKSYLVEGFLSSNNVSFEKAESTEELKLPDIAEKAERFTVLVGCWE